MYTLKNVSELRGSDSLKIAAQKITTVANETLESLLGDEAEALNITCGVFLELEKQTYIANLDARDLANIPAWAASNKPIREKTTDKIVGLGLYLIGDQAEPLKVMQFAHTGSVGRLARRTSMPGDVAYNVKESLKALWNNSLDDAALQARYASVMQDRFGIGF